MILATHLVIGAAVGAQTNNLAMAFGINLALHYFLDYLPHWDYLEKIVKKDVPKIAVDFVIGVFLLVSLYFIFSKNLNIQLFLAGALAGVLPDFLQGLYHLFGLTFLKFHNRFHRFIHYAKNQPITSGLGIQLLLIIICVLILLY